MEKTAWRFYQEAVGGIDTVAGPHALGSGDLRDTAYLSGDILLLHQRGEGD